MPLPRFSITEAPWPPQPPSPWITRSVLHIFLNILFSYSKVNTAEKNNLKTHVQDLTKAKENNIREIGELKLQLKLVEETRDNIRRELIDSQRKIREGDEAREVFRKELIDLKRQLKDSDREKDAVQTTANELRG
jgi:chromosome segregation ATPase